MKNVARCTQELTSAICASQAYLDFEKAKEEIRKNPELRAQLNQFRKKNYELQNEKGGSDWYEVVEEFEKQNEEFRKNPVVEKFLANELELCRMIQRINQAIVDAVQLEIQEFADVIDW